MPSATTETIGSASGESGREWASGRVAGGGTAGLRLFPASLLDDKSLCGALRTLGVAFGGSDVRFAGASSSSSHSSLAIGVLGGAANPRRDDGGWRTDGGFGGGGAMAGSARLTAFLMASRTSGGASRITVAA
jgi:hypothetical protein